MHGLTVIDLNPCVQRVINTASFNAFILTQKAAWSVPAAAAMAVAASLLTTAAMLPLMPLVSGLVLSGLVLSMAMTTAAVLGCVGLFVLAAPLVVPLCAVWLAWKMSQAALHTTAAAASVVAVRYNAAAAKIAAMGSAAEARAAGAEEGAGARAAAAEGPMAEEKVRGAHLLRLLHGSRLWVADSAALPSDGCSQGLCSVLLGLFDAAGLPRARICLCILQTTAISLDASGLFLQEYAWLQKSAWHLVLLMRRSHRPTHHHVHQLLPQQALHSTASPSGY